MFIFQLNTEWTQIEVIDLINDGSGLGFGIIGGRSTGVVVKTILPGGVADVVSIPTRYVSVSPFHVTLTSILVNKLLNSNLQICVSSLFLYKI